MEKDLWIFQGQARLTDTPADTLGTSFQLNQTESNGGGDSRGATWGAAVIRGKIFSQLGSHESRQFYNCHHLDDMIGGEYF